MTLLIISFIAGALTVLAPCILPLLPVIVGGSISGGEVSKKRAFTVTIALGLSVILFTLLLKASTLFINIPQNVWTFISGGIIILLGIITVFPNLWDKISFFSKVNQKSNQVLGAGYQKKSFWGDVIVGASLGPIFTTCSPTYFIVLATVLPVNLALGMVYVLAYAIGLCLALLLIALIGQRIVRRLSGASDPKGWFKRILGIIFILVGIGIIFGLDKTLQTLLLDAGFFDVTKIEQRLLELNTPQM